jgi:hypothetical protein
MDHKIIIAIIIVVAVVAIYYFWNRNCKIVCNSKNENFCWKWSEGRGVGTVPGYCDPDTQVKSGLLCYPKPKPGYTNVAGVAWEQCPSGYKDTGAHCLKPDSYGRGAGYAIWNEDKCNTENAQGCERSGLLWYPRCKNGFHPVGCCVCSPDCPPGMTDIGVSCQKRSYVVAPITPSCNKDQVYDAGLCYKACGEGQYGVGPICYKKCPKGTTPCGINEESSAACGTDAQDCAEKVFDMVMGVGNVIYKIADTVVSGGGFSNLTQIAKNAAISGLKTAAKSTAKEVAKLSLEQLKQVIQQKNPSLPPAAVDNLAKMEKNPDTFDYVGFLVNIDPSGLASVAKSFIHDICQ